MDKKIADILFSLLNQEMGFKTLPKDFSNTISQEDLKPLYLLAKKHDLAHIIGNALDKLGVLKDQSDAQNAFLKERSMAIFRTETLIAELEILCNELGKNQIDHIPLKGSFIRNLYPETWMRTSCDIDVLVKKEDLSRAISLLSDNLGYECRSIGQHDAQIYTPTGVHIELHYSLQEAETEKTAGDYLDSIWQVAISSGGYTKTMPTDFLYVYLMSHMIKHVKFGGCGIRAVMDVHLLNKTYDLSLAKKPLQECGFLAFAKGIENLAKAWFENCEKDELSLRLEEYILTGGVYGSFDNKIGARQSRQKTKFGYLLHRLFMPYRELKFKYPVLQKCAILYPFCLIARMFLVVFDKETKQRVVQEVKKSNEVAKGDGEIGKLLKDLEV